ncbi:MAG: MmcQ/YjbR family DNA-binding protein [Cyclobacteriaceae bacterium]|nr:MmcQ/YjbR family DNA-binding protein [Cyclobacteriaceae bacterium]
MKKASHSALVKLARSLKEVQEKPHFEKSSFRYGGKIFATSDEQKGKASLKISLVDQSVYCLMKPTIATPASGAWGRQGWTVFEMDSTPWNVLAEALKKAYSIVARKQPVGSQKSTAKIQTLHPDSNKTNKKISLDKYAYVRKHLEAILKSKELTHTQLMEVLYTRTKDSFEGGVQWYGETVKLDLEARGVIQRTGAKPEKYKLVKAKKAK